MSSNQKQTAGGGPQNQRYPTQIYQPIPTQSQRTDAFHVPAQAYVQQQQPNQQTNQAPNLRSIQPTGPPTQASTPPTNDLKVQSVQQPQQSMNHLYVGPQQQVRGNPGFYRPNQPTRMPSQHRGQQQIYPSQTPYIQMPVSTTMYLPNNLQYYNGQRPTFVPHQMVYGTQLQSLGFPPNANPPVSYTYFQMRQTHPPQTTVPPNAAQSHQNLSMHQTAPQQQQQQQQFTRPQAKRRANAIPIIDPATGADRLEELYEQASNSHPPSGESSARQTPQPINNNKEIRDDFANKVAQAARSESSIDDQEIHSSPLVVDHENIYHHSSSQNTGQPTSNLDHLVQLSNLKAHAKEFVSNSSNTAKETTPIVSANIDAVEVTLPNKQQIKDRESPAKGRKQREQQNREHNKDSTINKDTPVIRENVSDKESSNVVVKNSNDNISKTKETILSSNSNNNNATATGAAAIQSTTSVVTNKDNKEVVTTSTLPPPLQTTTPATTSHHRGDDKKNQKKDSNKTETKVPNHENNESGGNINQSSSAQSVQEMSGNAKSKNASQRAKDSQNKQQQQQQQLSSQANQKSSNQPQTPSVPPPQPSKANSKTSKKSELNQKGANKEGTDMDAFNDNANMQLDTVNANNEINANNNVGVNNTNNAPPSIPTSQQQQQPTMLNNDTNKNKNDGGTFRTETKTLSKNKIDITDIVKEKPKPIKSFPTSAAHTESQDETDKAALHNDKLVQAKNEANVKACENSTTMPLIENKPQLPYKEGQWAPDCPEGKKVYEKDFLMALRDGPASKRKPENLPDVILADDRGRLSDGRYSVGGRSDVTNIPFNFGGKSGSQRGQMPTMRKSQTKTGGGGGKGSKSQVIKLSISVREDVKLHEAENAWKPAKFLKSDNMSDDDRKTEALYKKVRGVLNKLTPQKFDTLVSQVRELEIDTADRLQGVIDLVFEKAVDEPNFSVAYALMCRELALMQVPVGPNSSEFVNFRKLLVTRCQKEFEKQSYDESVRNEKLKEINECNDSEKKKELQFELEEEDRKLRMKSVGNIRFIGELFKQQMLTVKIMQRCLDKLLSNKDGESLECLCKLLTTVGKELESKMVDLVHIFNAMKDIVEKKDVKVSSRVRFMLQDVIDLRRKNWVPRRQDANPKTIDQIQKEAENEQLNIQAMNSVPMTPRKDERGGNNAGNNSERKRRNLSDTDGWQTTSSRSGRNSFTVISDKLKNKLPQKDEPLGSSHMFGNWSKGSNIKADSSSTTPNTANMYAALEHIDSEKRPPGLRLSNKDPYSSKGPSLERSTYKQTYDGRGSRSGSQHRSNERDNNSSTPTSLPNTPKQQQNTYTMSDEQLERHLQNNLDEYLNDSCTIEEYNQDAQTYVQPSYFPRMVANGYLYVLDKTMNARIKTGNLFAKSINLGMLPLNDYCTGLEEVLNQADDLMIDIPKIWNYIAEILVHLICEGALPLNRLHKSCELLIKQGHGAKFLAPLFKLVISEKGPNFLTNCWQMSGLSLDDFMDSSQVDKFVTDNKLEFLSGGDPAAGQNQLSYEQISTKLTEFFTSKTSFDDIVNWIKANVGDKVKENKFIRALATTIFENTILRQKSQKSNDNLQDHYKLLQKYVDNNSNYELQVLYALQALIHKLEHPQGLLLTTCDRLYEDSIISQESFIAWEQSEDPAEQEGKGVALKQLTSFFTQLKENEEDDYASSSDEA